MKKEIERLNEEYKDILNGNEIWYEIERSDALDNRSARRYKITVVLGYNEKTNMLDVICEWGFCKDKEEIIKRFEKRLQERRNS